MIANIYLMATISEMDASNAPLEHISFMMVMKWLIVMDTANGSKITRKGKHSLCRQNSC